MKSLLLTEVFPPKVGGSGRWLYEVYRRLPEEAFVVAAGEHPHAGVFDETHRLAMCRMPLAFDTWGFFERGGFGQYVEAARRLIHLARRERVGAVHCGKLLPEGWLAWMLKMRLGLPYWIFVHGEELQYGDKSRQLGWMMRRVFRGAEGVIANSRNTAELIVRQWPVPAAKVHVVHPGVDAKYFVPAARDEAFRDLMGWTGKRVVLTVGRLQKRKGQDMLIRSLAAIRERVPNVLYAIMGDGEERQSLEALAREAGVCENVQFLGEAGNNVLLAAYQQCDLFALPNRDVNGDFEGFGMVLVEAQACGKPVIAGASGGTRETMQIEKTGLLVDCTRPERLAAAVGELLLDERRSEDMGRAGRAFAVANFDWPRLAEQVGGILGIGGESLVASGQHHEDSLRRQAAAT